ncbi:CYTH domain-containing protein [Marinobacter xestospongiae]|uniref:CYTH domain-containing protein n=1 Tax=Marinobacter xestospongiae TaxID=994319 RepID=UPI00200335E3|nr:CYTH domain-containing protein [Marinobacter xestospongiae]MCK7568316.1 CYTH domain-containing protein [Marinobacter xestospongiae]
MAQELEIKLTLSPATAEAAFQWLSELPEAAAGETKALINTYFDTPKAELNRQRAALRVRRAGDRYIQTLKTQGEFRAGAHRRQEWEWPLTGTRLNLGLLADTPLAEGVNLAELEPVFETNFERRIVMLEEGDTVIECAFDLGRVIAGDQSRPLCEVEFELKAGDERRLLHWATRLSAAYSCFLNLISKAEQGYFLAGLHDPSALAPDSDALTRLCHGVSVGWLTGALTDELRLALDDVLAGYEGVLSEAQKTDLRRLRDSPDPEVVENLGALQLALINT